MSRFETKICFYVEEEFDGRQTWYTIERTRRDGKIVSETVRDGDDRPVAPEFARAIIAGYDQYEEVAR